MRPALPCDLFDAFTKPHVGLWWRAFWDHMDASLWPGPLRRGGFQVAIPFRTAGARPLPAGPDGFGRSAPHYPGGLGAQDRIQIWRIGILPVDHHLVSNLAQPFLRPVLYLPGNHESVDLKSGRLPPAIAFVTPIVSQRSPDRTRRRGTGTLCASHRVVWFGESPVGYRH